MQEKSESPPPPAGLFSTPLLQPTTVPTYGGSRSRFWLTQFLEAWTLPTELRGYGSFFYYSDSFEGPVYAKVLVVLVVLVSSTYSSGGSSSCCCGGGGNTSSSSCCCGSLVAWDICAPGPAAPVLPPLLLRDDLHTHPCCGSGRMKQKKSICPFQFCFKGLFFWCFFYRFADLKQLWLSEIKR